MKKAVFLVFLFCTSLFTARSQGLNHTWLLGLLNVLDTNTTSTKSRLNFDNSSINVIPETRKMAFNATQANISDDNGNLIAASNGCWIMDATGDTMQNGSGLNPGSWVSSYCSSTTGSPMSHANLFIPYPGDTAKLVLFHQIGNFNANLNSTELFYTVIDRSLNGGKGGIIPNKKNIVAFNDTLSWGFTACKHANGRDWWIVGIRDNSNTLIKILFDTSGIDSISFQTVNMPIPHPNNAGQPCFSPDGKKFAYTSGYAGVGIYQDIRIFSFNRCNGQFDSLGYIYKSNQDGFGLSFSSNSKYLYYSSFSQIFQLDTDVPNIASTDSVVATYDGYCYPYPNQCTDFWLMYLAANGKIYITSSHTVIDLHYINSPDSTGTACDVQQHALRTPCYTDRGGLNHPNYYLGCDTTLGCACLATGIYEIIKEDFHFKIYPNPVKNILNIGYLLPQNKNGVFEIMDVTGKIVFKYYLPPWSNEQSFELTALSDGVYSCSVTSNNYRQNKKLVVIRK